LELRFQTFSIRNLLYIQLNEKVEQITLQETDIFVREYQTKDAEDLMNAGYPFTDTGEWGTPYKDLKLKIINHLENKARKRLVAHCNTDKKPVGTVKMEEIGKHLWGIWTIFVSSPYRRRGIGSLLYRSAFDLLREMDVRKAIGNVEVTNLPSIKALEKTWDGFISQSYYRYTGVLRHTEKYDRIVPRSFVKFDLDQLFKVYQQSINADWRTFLEIDKNNFLERFFGHIHSKGLLQLSVRKRVFIAEESGSIVGYLIMPTSIVPLHRYNQRLYLFLSPQIALGTAMGFIQGAFSLLVTEGCRTVYLYFTNVNKDLMSKISNALYTVLGLTKTEFLLSKKNL